MNFETQKIFIIGQWVYPLHRLDRAASGIVLFGLSAEAAGQMIRQFGERKVEKRYLAVARGYLPEEMKELFRKLNWAYDDNSFL